MISVEFRMIILIILVQAEPWQKTALQDDFCGDLADCTVRLISVSWFCFGRTFYSGLWLYMNWNKCWPSPPFAQWKLALHCFVDYIWVKLSWTDIFPKSCHFFFNFNSCFWALLALSHLLRLIFLVNHVGRGRQNWFLDLPPHVRYLKTTSKHGWFGGFHPLFLLLYYFSMLPNQAKTFKNLSIVFVLCMETLFSFVSLSFYHL